MGNASSFTGPLSFLSTYQYIMQDTGLLTGIGATTEFQSGVAFWNRYGRSKRLLLLLCDMNLVPYVISLQEPEFFDLSFRYAFANSKIIPGLYNASIAQNAYNSTFNNGTARPPIVLRTTSQSRIENSQISWALGFFGPSYETVPSPTLANVCA